MSDEITSDGRTVWVNSGRTGCALGRFSRMGIDVHTEEGDGCFDCAPGPCGPAEWLRFKESMKKYHGVIVSEEHRPRYLEES